MSPDIVNRLLKGTITSTGKHCPSGCRIYGQILCKILVLMLESEHRALPILTAFSNPELQPSSAVCDIDTIRALPSPLRSYAFCSGPAKLICLQSAASDYYLSGLGCWSPTNHFDLPDFIPHSSILSATAHSINLQHLEPLLLMRWLVRGKCLLTSPGDLNSILEIQVME